MIPASDISFVARTAIEAIMLGTSGTASLQAGKSFDRRFAVLILLMAAVISAGGWLYYQPQATNARLTARDTVGTVADLKAQSIANWVKERRGDAEIVRISVVVRGLLVDPASAELRRATQERVRVFRQVYGYAAVVLADNHGAIQLKDPDDYALPESLMAEHVQAALHTQKVEVSDLHRAPAVERAYLWVSCPLIGRVPASGSDDGAALLVVDPRTFLYPTLQEWPIPSRTAEVLLVLLKGGNVEFLNEPRGVANRGAASVKSEDTKWPALTSLAAPGAEGIFEATDNRGVRVIAAVRKVAGTPWLLVAKVDEEEILAPLRQEAWKVGIMTTLLLIATTLGIGLLWRQEKLVYVRASEARFRTLIENAPVAVSITRDAKTIHVNQKMSAKRRILASADDVVDPAVNASRLTRSKDELLLRYRALLTPRLRACRCWMSYGTR